MAESVDAKQVDSDAFYDPHCEPCRDNKGSYVDVYGYCHECYKFLCPACHRKHSKRKTTKTHAIRKGEEMPMSIAAKPPRYDACNIHPGMLKDHFCEQHKCLICSSCGSSCHKDCCVSTVEDVCKLIQSSDFKVLGTTINDHYQNLKSFESLIYTHVNRLQEEREDMVLRIQSLYEELVSELEREYTAAKEEIESTYKSKFNLMVHHQKAISKLVKETDVYLSQSRQLCSSPLDEKAFLKSQELINNTNLSSRHAQELQQSLSFVSIRFEPEEYFGDLLSSQVKFGSLSVDECVAESKIHFSKIATFPFSQDKCLDTTEEITHTPNDDADDTLQQTETAIHLGRIQTENDETTVKRAAVQKQDTNELQEDKESFQNLTITTQKHVTNNVHLKAYRGGSYYVALQSDQYVCNISGMAVTEDGRRLLVDKANRKIKMFSPTSLSAIPDMMFLGCIPLYKKPFDIAVVNSHEAVVTTDDKSLVVLGIDNGVFFQSLYVKKIVELGFSVRGVARHKDKFVITCPEVHKPSSVKLMDTSGTVYWSVSNQGLSKPSYVCGLGDGASSHILVQDHNRLIVLEGATGKITATHRSKYKGIGGLATDKDGNIYHCYSESKEICLVHACLLEETTLLTNHTSLPGEPNSMMYDRVAKKLMVSYHCIDKVDFFELDTPSVVDEKESSIKDAKLKLEFARTTRQLTFLDSLRNLYRWMAASVNFSCIKSWKLYTDNVNPSGCNVCDISGIAETKDGMLIFIDKESATVSVYWPATGLQFKHIGWLLKCLKLPAKPRDLAVTNNHEAIVTTDKKSLIILDVTKGHCCVKERVTLQFGVKGIAKYTEDTFAVSCPDENPACVKLIDKAGNVYWSSSGKRLFTNPWYVACNEREVIVTDRNDWITKLDGQTGSVIARKDMKNRGPACVINHSDGNIFVCNSKSNEVVLISDDFSKEKVLLSNKKDVQAMQTCGSEGFLMLSYRGSKEVDVYELSYLFKYLLFALLGLFIFVSLKKG